MQCHPVCRLFVIEIEAEKLHIGISPRCVSAAIQAVNGANWPCSRHLTRRQNTCSPGFAPNHCLHKTTVNNVLIQSRLPKGLWQQKSNKSRQKKKITFRSKTWFKRPFLGKYNRQINNENEACSCCHLSPKTELIFV